MATMHRREFLAVTSLAAAWPRPSLRAAGRQADQRFDVIARLVEQKMTEYRVPGVGLGIATNGQLTIRGFGVTNVDDPQPITADTVFTIASISKTVTATAIMKLIEQGRAELKAPVSKYLPEFRVVDEAVSREVTLWHLLTHTPGWEGQLSSEDRGAEALAHFAMTILREVPQLARPGEVWSYNNAGFSLAGRVIEVITGRNIHDALRQLVFTPIGRVDAESVEDFTAAVIAAARDAKTTGATLVVDLAQLPFMVSRGLRALTMAQREGAAMKLAAPSAQMVEILKISRYDKLFEILDEA